MELGLFQLLPGSGLTAREVIDQGLWEARFAEEHGFESVWLAEHHVSDFGLISAPSVYAAALAAMTRRIRIGFAVAVLPLHQPLRLAEEISWLTHLSGGRIAVGVGPGFSAEEFAAYDVPLDERHARYEDALVALRRALQGEESRFKIRPAPASMPPIYRACSSVEAVRRAAGEGTPVLLGLKSKDDIAQMLALHDDAYVLRQIYVAPTAAESKDGMPEGPGVIRGTPEIVLAELQQLEELGARRVIGWFHTAGLPYENIRRSMELAAAEVLPSLRRSTPWQQSSSSASRPASGWRSAS